jgi:transposase
VTAANVNDATVFAGVAGRRPGGADSSGSAALTAGQSPRDKGYDARHCRRYLRRRGIRPRIACHGIESSQRLGRQRWRVERALSWLSCYRRLQVRWDRGSGQFFAFVLLACALVCFHRLSAAPTTGRRGGPLPDRATTARSCV